MIRPAWVPCPPPVNGAAPTGILEMEAMELGGTRSPDERRGKGRTPRDRDPSSTALPHKATTLRKSADTAQDHHMSEDGAANRIGLAADAHGTFSAKTNAVEPAKEEDTSMDDLTRSFDAVLEFVPRGVRKREKRKGVMDTGM